MDSDQLVWVYRYIYWDESAQRHKTSAEYATREAILNGLGVIVPTSGVKVPFSLVRKDTYTPGTEEAETEQPRA